MAEYEHKTIIKELDDFILYSTDNGELVIEIKGYELEQKESPFAVNTLKEILGTRFREVKKNRVFGVINIVDDIVEFLNNINLSSFFFVSSFSSISGVTS